MTDEKKQDIKTRIHLRIDRLDRYREEDLERIGSFLSRDQKEKLASIKDGKAKRQSLLAASLLEETFLDLGLQGPLSYGKLPNGKPCLLNRPGLDFSVSHSGNLASAAAADLSFEPGLGLDVEDLSIREQDPDHYMKLAERFFSSEEVEMVRRGLPDGLYFSWEEEDLELTEDVKLLRRFFRIWTFKEAYAKAVDRPLIRVLKEEAYRPDRPDLICMAREDSILSLVLAGHEIKPEDVVLHGSFTRTR